MKKGFLLVFSIFSIISCKSINNKKFDNSKTRNSDTGLTLTLNQFKIDSCLSDLFLSISNADKDSSKQTDKAYSVTLFHNDKYLYLNVKYEHLYNMRYTDYFGFFNLNNLTFFCRGDSSQKILAKILNQTREFRIEKYQPSKDEVTFARDPVLEGTYYGCQGLAIKMEIYVNSIIPGFEMKTVK